MSRPWFGRRGSGARDAGGTDAGGGVSGGGVSGGGVSGGGVSGGGVSGGGVSGDRGRSVAGPVLAEVTAPLITIDALGRKCPIPIIMLAEQIRDVPVGAVIAVLADDPAAYTDIPAWCSLKSHDCVYRGDLPSGWSFGVRRRY